ncbi:EAP30/Vps36 family-domain-containing protein [Lipomyces tetrasporus]|uniref:Vacuolar protein-sorting-associated protein 36 n=1 Tax=Lipomyces tetrasporus TaxID=54092 RepID=A0AAD7QXB2_9ASCO|nr:EAP30/Vps36 family-domain-containing protein [Lipomyces tetrasporus]KAJ8103008.1 EAP30/Vps36 family-domain-containing protein [Lipomyces tetrasporus]
MRFWSPIDLTAAYRPVLFVDETDILVQNSVGIYEERVRLPGYQNGRLYLTSHRICYVDIASPLTNSVAVNLPDVRTIQYTAGFLKSSPKITFHFADTLSSTSSPVSPSSANGTPQSRSPSESTVSLPNLSKNFGAVSPKQSTGGLISMISWICPICSHSNNLPPNYRASISPIPPCTTCGVKPPESVIQNALAETATNRVTRSLANDDSSSTSSGADLDERACPKCTFLNNSAMRFCEICGARLRTTAFNPSDYILNKNIATKESYLPFTIGRGSQSSGFGVEAQLPTFVKISFRDGGDKAFYEKTKEVLTERTWLKNLARAKQMEPTITITKNPEPQPSNEGPITPSFGINGLQRMVERERMRNQDLMSSLDDLHSLMKKARDMVSLAEGFAIRLAASPGVPDEARRALRESSQALSLSSPIVTKQMAGGGSDQIYYSELARQLAEFLDNGVLKSEGGIATLFDVFALYNRARGISLISPKDLYSACSTFEKLGLPFRMRRFKSGLTVVQEALKNDDITIRTLVDWIKTAENKQYGEDNGVTAQDVSQQFGWSVGVCVEELETAQEQGKLCSDAVVEGTRYFVNMIGEASWDWKYELFKAVEKRDI